MDNREYLKKLSKTLVEHGQLIEAGWVSLRVACDLVDAPDDQIREMRMAFFAGAQHMFSSLMTVFDEGDEPTDDDMRRVMLIDKELKLFIQDFELRNLPTKGTG